MKYLQTPSNEKEERGKLPDDETQDSDVNNGAYKLCFIGV